MKLTEKLLVGFLVLTTSLFCACSIIFADDTTFYTTVPKTYSLHFNIYGEGYIMIDDTLYEKNSVITVYENENYIIKFFPGNDAKLDKVLLNGEDTTLAIKYNALLLKDVDTDITLDIIFRNEDIIIVDTGTSAEKLTATFIVAFILLLILVAKRLFKQICDN